jgi:hypothetical protein
LKKGRVVQSNFHDYRPMRINEAPIVETHVMEELCKEMRPGTPVAKIRPAIEKHGLWNGLVAYQFDHEGGKGYYREQTKTWDYGVPSPMTLGDTECFISHDGSVVVHTEVMY